MIGLNNVINVYNLNYYFFIIYSMRLKGSNVQYLPKEINNTQDYIKASDYVITKAGWGTLSKALLAEKNSCIFKRYCSRR